MVATKTKHFRGFPTATKFSMQPTCNQTGAPVGTKKEPLKGLPLIRSHLQEGGATMQPAATSRRLSSYAEQLRDDAGECRHRGSTDDDAEERFPAGMPRDADRTA